VSLPPADTADLRTGAPLHDDLLALLPLVGVWEGTGTGRKPSDGSEFRYGQRVSFAHDGRRFLVYESRSWLLDEDGGLIRLALRESGFWRPGSSDDDLEVTVAAMTGLSEVFTGVAGDLQWEIVSLPVTGTPTAAPVERERRFYAVVGDKLHDVTQLHYATELHLPGRGFEPHLNATLTRQ
jgi:hypothetical protein